MKRYYTHKQKAFFQRKENFRHKANPLFCVKQHLLPFYLQIPKEKGLQKFLGLKEIP